MLKKKIIRIIGFKCKNFTCIDEEVLIFLKDKTNILAMAKEFVYFLFLLVHLIVFFSTDVKDLIRIVKKILINFSPLNRYL